MKDGVSKASSTECSIMPKKWNVFYDFNKKLKSPKASTSVLVIITVKSVGGVVLPEPSQLIRRSPAFWHHTTHHTIQPTTCYTLPYNPAHHRTHHTQFLTTIHPQFAMYTIVHVTQWWTWDLEAGAFGTLRHSALKRRKRLHRFLA